MGKRVLIIDDDRNLRVLVRTFLEKAGYTVLEAEDGAGGLALHTEKPVDLLIIDIFMPNKDGFETMIDLMDRSQKSKILAISAGGRATGLDFLHQAKMFGAHATLAKPFTKEELLEAVDKLLG